MCVYESAKSLKIKHNYLSILILYIEYVLNVTFLSINSKNPINFDLFAKWTFIDVITKIAGMVKHSWDAMFFNPSCTSVKETP